MGSTISPSIRNIAIAQKIVIPKKLNVADKRARYQNKFNLSRSSIRSRISSRVDVVKTQENSDFMRKYSTNNLMTNLPNYKSGSRYQTIISEIISQRESVMSTIVDKSEASPRQNINPKQLEIIKPNLYFFDNENPNKVIKRAIGGGHKSHSISRSKFVLTNI